MRLGRQLKASIHAQQRIKERIGNANKKEIKAIVKNAYHNGLCMKRNFIPKETLLWVDKKVNSKYFGRANEWRILEKHLFLFSRDLTLITVIEVPGRLLPRKKLERF